MFGSSRKLIRNGIGAVLTLNVVEDTAGGAVGKIRRSKQYSALQRECKQYFGDSMKSEPEVIREFIMNNTDCGNLRFVDILFLSSEEIRLRLDLYDSGRRELIRKLSDREHGPSTADMGFIDTAPNWPHYRPSAKHLLLKYIRSIDWPPNLPLTLSSPFGVLSILAIRGKILAKKSQHYIP